MVEKVECPFVGEAICADGNIYVRCDRKFAKEHKLETFRYHGNRYYSLARIAATDWFSAAQIEAFGKWLGENGFKTSIDVAEIEWLDDGSDAFYAIGKGSDGSLYVSPKVLKMDGKGKGEVRGVMYRGENFVKLDDVLALDDCAQNQMVATIARARCNL